MSRIGKLPVAIPEKVKVSVNDGAVSVEGPKGKLEKAFNLSHVSIVVEENEVKVSPANSSRLSKAMHGTARSIINGMVEGVTKGFEKKLEINGVGFKAEQKGKQLKLNLGFSHDVLVDVPEGITVAIDGGTKVAISGCDKQVVGQLAATIYSYYPVEPYKGKGVTIVGQYVRRKEGKKAG
jgi:large subunit ribosomal protein L6